MGPCEPNADRWLDHLYGLLSDQQSRELADHVAQCASCQATLAAAQRDQQRMARAASLLRNIPEFQLPAEELSQAPAIFPAPADSAPLPFKKHVRRSLAQRLWPIWVAAAALLLAIFGGMEWYRNGAAERDRAVIAAQKQLGEIEGALVALKAKADAEPLALVQQAQAATLRLSVVGAAQAHPEAPYACRIATRSFDDQPLAAKLEIRLVRADTGDVLHRQTVESTGAADVVIPAGLKLEKGIRLEVAASSGSRQAEVSENLPVSPASHVVHLAMNKSTYQIGEVVFFRALALERYSLKPPGQPVPLRFALVNGDGKKVLTVDRTTGAGGIASGEFALVSALPAGNYTVQVAAADRKTQIAAHTRSLEIVEHLSDLEIVPQNKSYRAGDKVVMNLVARSDDGKPLANQLLSVKPNIANKPDVKGITGLKAFTDLAGKAVAQFTIPKDYQGARLNVTVEMRRLTKDGNSTYTKIERSIAVTPPRLEVDFYPEGGDLVAGIAQRIYYRVRTPSGETAAINGTFAIESAQGTIAKSEANQSLGSFVITPDPKQSYTLRVPGADAISNPFAKLGIKADGIVLQVANSVAVEGEAIHGAVHQGGPVRQLLAVATCRGQIVGQQFIDAKATEFDMKLPAGVGGLVRLTVYETRAQRLVPLAERLVYRTPAARLDVKAAAANVQAGKTGQVKIEARDEQGKLADAWALAVLVDGRYRGEQNERSLGGHFLLASEFGADLADAPLLADDSAATRKTLELFLGTRGWRRFVANEQAEPAQFAEEKAPGLLRAESGDSTVLAAKVKQNLQALQERIDREQAQLESDRQAWAASAATALSARHDYARLPGEYLRLGLGILAAAALLAGVLGMIIGMVRIARHRAATPAFGAALGALGLCMVLYLTAGSVMPIAEVRPGDGMAKLAPFPRIEATLKDKIAPATPLSGALALAAPARLTPPTAPRYAPDLAGALVMASETPPAAANRAAFIHHPQMQERFQAAQKMQQATPQISPAYGREFALQNPGADAQPTLLWHPQLRITGGQGSVAFDVPQGPATYRLLIYGHSAEGRLGFAESRIEVQP